MNVINYVHNIIDVMRDSGFGARLDHSQVGLRAGDGTGGVGLE
jgi:hypothetical protein